MPYSDRMRSELAANVDRGDSDDRTLQTFVEKIWPCGSARSYDQGFNRVAWIMPFLALALGLLTTIFTGKTPLLALSVSVFSSMPAR